MSDIGACALRCAWVVTLYTVRIAFLGLWPGAGGARGSAGGPLVEGQPQPPKPDAVLPTSTHTARP